jgi:succinyl-CoA synthetase beta subunit
MDTHEYQAKHILIKHHIPVPPFAVVSQVQETEDALFNINSEAAVVKIQVHAGGRGKAQGVKIGSSKEEVKKLVASMLGMKMVNNQTGPEGVIARKVMLTPPVNIQKEYYLSCILDRKEACITMIASKEGGMDIEEVAHKDPKKILTLPIDLYAGPRGYQLVRLAKFMGWSGEVAKMGKTLAKNLVKAFVDTDATLLEINPLVLTKEEKLVALDAKLSIDDNALFRQREAASFYDPMQVKPAEKKAHECELSYVALSGNIGCMVNGAGLAMATMDMIHHHGGEPANFLDVGGSATTEKVAEGFQIILEDPNVKAILVNIFGGIMNCKTIAEGVIEATKRVKITIPLIVRLEGTNAKEGKKLIQQAAGVIITADNLTEAAQKAIAAIK